MKKRIIFLLLFLAVYLGPIFYFSNKPGFPSIIPNKSAPKQVAALPDDTAAQQDGGERGELDLLPPDQEILLLSEETPLPPLSDMQQMPVAEAEAKADALQPAVLPHQAISSADSSNPPLASKPKSSPQAEVVLPQQAAKPGILSKAEALPQGLQAEALPPLNDGLNNNLYTQAKNQPAQIAAKQVSAAQPQQAVQSASQQQAAQITQPAAAQPQQAVQINQPVAAQPQQATQSATPQKQAAAQPLPSNPADAEALPGANTPQLTLAEADFVNLRKLPVKLFFDIKYATTDNFTGQQIYTSPACYLKRPAAMALLRAAEKAQTADVPFYLCVYDCYRPPHAQFVLWQALPKSGLVANPHLSGSNHSKGMAVDIGPCDETGSPLPTPTKFDEFTPLAYSDATEGISAEALKNRNNLQKIMRSAGFITIKKEWWHFDYQGYKKHPAVQITDWE